MQQQPLENETLATIYQRRSIRQFQDTLIDDAVIQKILDSANQAPSAHNQQSWKFIVVRGQKKQQLAQLVRFHQTFLVNLTYGRPQHS